MLQHRRLIALLVFAALVTVSAGCSEHQVPASRYREPLFADVRVTRDLAYGPESPQRLDVYEPARDGVTSRPAVVWIHGGGFASGDKASGTLSDFPSELARLGYVAVAIDYRLLAPQACIAAELSSAACRDAAKVAADDARAAVGYVRDHARDFRVDPSRIAIAGVSAGGITASRVGTTGADSGVRAWVSVSGGLDPSTLTIDSDAAPGLLFGGTVDPWVPYRWSAGTAAALRAAGVPVELRTLDGEGHVPVARHDFFFGQMRDFLYRELALGWA